MRSRVGSAVFGGAWLVSFFFMGLTRELRAEHLSLDAAVTRARLSSAPVLVAEQQVQEAAASRVGQRVFFPNNPRVFADYRPLAIEMVGQPTEPRHGYNVGIDGLLEVSGAGALRAQEADRRTDVAQHERDMTRARQVAITWLAYVSAQVASLQETQVQESLALQERVASAVRERARLGVAAEPDVAVASVELASMKTQLLGAKRERTLALVALADALDLEVTASVTLDRLPETLPNAESIAGLTEEALDSRPELAAARARLNLLDATHARLTRETVPRVGYNFGLDAAPASPAFAYIGLSIELPVAQRNQGPRAVALAQKHTEQIRLEALQRSIVRDVVATWNSYGTRTEQLASLSNDALPAAERAVQLVEEGYRAGRFELFRLTTALRDMLRIRQERLLLIRAAWADYIELQRASGRLDK